VEEDEDEDEDREEVGVVERGRLRGRGCERGTGNSAVAVRP